MSPIRVKEGGHGDEKNTPEEIDRYGQRYQDAGNGASTAPVPRNEEIARRAHEIFLARGGEHGHDLEDWLRAERELLERNAGGRVASR